MARDPLFQRASGVENVQRLVADAVDIRAALFIPYGFFKIERFEYQMSLDLKHALLNMFNDVIPYDDLGNIPCADGCKSLLKVCHVHQRGYNGISAYPILLFRDLALRPFVNRNRTTMILAMH